MGDISYLAAGLVAGGKLRGDLTEPGRAGAQQGGIIEDEGHLDVSNVMLVNPADSKPSRIRVEERDGKRTRVFTRGGEAVPEPTVS